MYVIKLLSESKELQDCTQRTIIYQKESLIDELLFLIPPMYNDKDLSDFTVALEYLDVVNVPHVEVLDKEDELYKGYLAYKLPVTTNLTQYAGNIKMNLSISKVDLDEKKHYVMHTGTVVLNIEKHEDYYNFIPDQSLEFVDKLIANMEVKVKELKEISETYDKEKADNIRKQNNTVQLTANGNPIGDPITIGSGDGGDESDWGFDIVEF